MAFSVAARSAVVARPALASRRSAAAAPRRVSIVRAEPEDASPAPAAAETPAVVEVSPFHSGFFSLYKRPRELFFGTGVLFDLKMPP